jgi:hypothetical protein
VSRLIGWSAERIDRVDHALRAVRTCATRRVPLVLCGDGDLVAIARDLHRRVLGDGKPFVVCDPRRRKGDATIRTAQSFEKGLPALAAANGGTLCVWSRYLPRDWNKTDRALRDPSARTQLVVCAHEPSDGKPFHVAPVSIPPLTSRANELGRVVDEYAADAALTLGARDPLPRSDREWILTHSATTLAEIEKSTARLVAVRKAGTVVGAAELLGMSHSALSRWLARREL